MDPSWEDPEHYGKAADLSLNVRTCFCIHDLSILEAFSTIAVIFLQSIST
jgi:hypothetical protein